LSILRGRFKITANGWQLCEGGNFSTYAQSESSTSNLAQNFQAKNCPAALAKLLSAHSFHL